MKYKYLIGGITIATDISYPEMIESNLQPEVELSYGKVPGHLEENTVHFPFIEANKNQYLLKLPRVGRYLVENGNKITMEAEEKVSAGDMERLVLTSLFGVLSYQREMIPMHGGVFLLNGKGILVSGLSGSGKSTLLASLYQKGYTLISDDISNLKMIGGKAMAFPGFPRLLLWKDTMVKLNMDESKSYRMRSDMEKYLVPLDEASFREPVELSKIVVLKNKEHKEQEIVKGLNKMEGLKRNTYKPWMVNAFGKQPAIFGQLLALAGQVPVEKFVNDHQEGVEAFRNSFIEKISQDVK